MQEEFIRLAVFGMCLLLLPLVLKNRDLERILPKWTWNNMESKYILQGKLC